MTKIEELSASLCSFFFLGSTTVLWILDDASCALQRMAKKKGEKKWLLLISISSLLSGSWYTA